LAALRAAVDGGQKIVKLSGESDPSGHYQNLTMKVADTLYLLNGIWHDRVVIHAPDGAPMDFDPHGGTPGPAPYDNLVYIQFDGHIYAQTNVTFRGRPTHVRSFTAQLVDGILRFDTLGPNDPKHIGVSGGDRTVIFCAEAMTEAWQRYNEPDWIYLPDDHTRLRATVLYRHGVAVRSLRANGTRLAHTADSRHAWDPRGLDGPVHQARSVTHVYHRDNGTNE
jgi:hypothetical protein